MFNRKQRMSNAQVIALGFIVVIIIGTFFLTLPIASRNGEWTNPIDALFTAVSSTCVTGLVVVDTYTHWTVFGQLVILFMIQIGGLGFITMGDWYGNYRKDKNTERKNKVRNELSDDYVIT